MIEVRCCCTPENLIGHIPGETGITAGLELRELTDGTWAFSSEELDPEDLDDMPGFVRAQGGTRKTWKKTWRKK